MQNHSDQGNDSKQVGETETINQSETNYAKVMQSAHKVVQIGTKFIDDPFQSMQVDLSENPKGLQEKDDKNKLITFLITFHKKTDDAAMQYQPQYFNMIDEQGKEYKLYHLEETSDSDWNRVKVRNKGKVVIEATYEVPKESGK